MTESGTMMPPPEHAPATSLQQQQQRTHNMPGEGSSTTQTAQPQQQLSYPNSSDGIAVQIDESAAAAGYQHYDDTNNNNNKRPGRTVVNDNYAAHHEGGTANGEAETTSLLDHLYRFYWRSQAAARNNRYSDSSGGGFPLLLGQMPYWLWSTTWTFLASWLTVVQCRMFSSPWTSSSLGSGYSQPSGNLQDGTVASRDEVFVQNLVRAIEANDQAAFVRLLNDSVDTGRNQTCLNSPVAFTYRGKPVLHYAVRFQRVEMVEILLTHCAEYCVVDTRQTTTAADITEQQAAATTTTSTTMESEVHAYYASLVDDGGNNALHEMSRFAYVDERMMRLLLAHGCQPSERNMRGYTCAQEALQQNNVRFCLTLCDVWPQAKHKLIREVIATAATQIGGNTGGGISSIGNKRAAGAVLQLLSGLLVAEQFDGTIDALLSDRNSTADDASDAISRSMLLDIDLNRVDAEKPVNILHEALRTGLVGTIADGENASQRRNGTGCADHAAMQQQQQLLRLLLRNAHISTDVCDENFTRAKQRLWNASNSSSGQTTADDIDGYLSPQPQQSRSDISLPPRQQQRPTTNGALSQSSSSDLAAYFQPPQVLLSRSVTSTFGDAEIFGQNQRQTAEAWAWLHAVCPKLYAPSAIVQSRIEYEPSKRDEDDDDEAETEKSTSSSRNTKTAKIICTIRMPSHHLISSVMLTPGPLSGAYKATLFSMPSSAVSSAPRKSKGKSSLNKDYDGILLGEFSSIAFPGNDSPSYRVKYRLTLPQKVQHLMLVLTPSSSVGRKKDGRGRSPAANSGNLLPTDVAVFGIEENLRQLMFEQLRLGKPQIIELLRNGINSSDTLIHMPRFGLRQLMSRSGCRMPAITRMLDFVDTLSGGEACPVSRIEWLVQPPRVGWEMRDIGAQTVVLTIDESNKWSRITRSIDVELLISSERGGPPMRRVTRVDIPRPMAMAGLTAAAARRVVAEFSDIRLPYGNYKLMARVKRKPKLMAYDPEHVLEIKIAYYGGDYTPGESITMSAASGRVSMTSKPSYFERQQQQQTSSASSSSGWLGYVVSWLPGLEDDGDGTDTEMHVTSSSASSPAARAAASMHGGFQSSEYAMLGTT